MGNQHRQNHWLTGETDAGGGSQQDCGRWQRFVLHHCHGGGQAWLAGSAPKTTSSLTIEGPGEIVATDNGDATSFESFQAPERDAYNGLALVIVRAKAGQTGTIVA